MDREISAGVLDAGFSSLATFAIGFFAASSLSPEELGAYAIVFATFVLVTRFPTQMVFKPVEVAVASFPRMERIQVLRDSLRLGTLPTMVAALSTSLWILAAPSALSREVMIALSVTAVACALVSPVQDHVRHLLHLAGASWAAAVVSAVQLGVAIAGAALLTKFAVPPPWVPFGVLGLANLTSLSIGILITLALPSRTPTNSYGLGLRKLFRLGGWLLPVALIPSGAAVIGSALVSHLAGPAALGYAEAARIVGQPPFVVAMGLAAVLGPRSLRAARAGRRDTARQISRLYASLMWLIGLPYLALVGLEWAWNPLHRLLPNAYQLPGLVAAMVLGSILMGMDWPYRSELVGGGKAAALARLEGIANAARVLVTGTAQLTGAYAIPMSLVALAAARSVGYRLALRSVWQPRGEAEALQSADAEDFLVTTSERRSI